MLEATITKSRSGWCAETKIDMPDLPASGLMSSPGRRELRITTRKAPRGGLYASAMVVTKCDDGTMTFAIGGDYSATVALNTAVRCTEKSVRTMHESVIGDPSIMGTLKESVRAFYASKEARHA